jgi:hypothetical protein
MNTIKKENEESDIIIRLNIASSALIGYGEVFLCNVVAVDKGNFSDTVVRVVVLAANKELNKTFSSAGKDLLEAGFTKKKAHEPYALMPINGFVDDNKTSWEIIFARRVTTNQ